MISKKKIHFSFLRHTILFSVFFLFPVFASAQAVVAQDSVTQTPDTAQGGGRYVHVIRADKLYHYPHLPDIQILMGDVQFRHENAWMYCDSAYFSPKESTFDAYGNVRIVDSDTLFIYGDFLFYNGNTKMARMRENVRLENSTATLTTDSLNYDRNLDLAYYYTGGQLQDDQNILTSIWGQYSPPTKQALFKDSVKLTNPSYVMYADTLKYNTETHIADIVGDTHIIYNDETNIYSTLGWYNTETEQSMLLDRSLIVHKDGKTLTGDTLFYNKLQNYVEGFKDVALSDTIQKATLYGDYVFYNELTEYGMATDSALLVDWSSLDTLYMHADTLRVLKDSIYDVANAYYNVRFYRNDMQGACDSLVYLSRDSIATMYGEPVVWNGANQLSGEIIEVYLKDSTVDKMVIPEKALAVQPVDTVKYFNQLSGKELTAFIENGELSRVEVSGSVESIFYPIDDKDSVIVGINKTQSSFLTMYFKEEQIERIKIFPAPTAVMYPLEELSGDDLYVNSFFFIDEQRPKRWEDVFLRFTSNRHKSDVIHVRSAASMSDGGSASSSGEKGTSRSPQNRNTPSAAGNQHNHK